MVGLEGLPGNREVLYCTLGLCRVEGILGYLHFTHRVVLNAVFRHVFLLEIASLLRLMPVWSRLVQAKL